MALEEGGRVEVTGGKYKGKSGRIVKVTEKMVSVRFDDGDHSMIQQTSVKAKAAADPAPAPPVADPIDRSDPAPATPSEPAPATPSEPSTPLRSPADVKPTSEYRRGLGTLEKGLLRKTASFDADTTASLLAAGAKMPEHVPLVTPSFATRDLVNNGTNSDGTFAGGDFSELSGAGRDPWSVCDFLRDALHWPRDAIFIDSEQFGFYAHPADFAQGQSLTYVEDGTWRPWCAEGSFEVEPKDDTKEGRLRPQRNYRGVFKYFFSAGWEGSANCTIELDDLIDELQEAGGEVGIREERAVVFVVLDEEVRSKAAAQRRRIRELALSEQQIHLIDLSPYMEWLRSNAARVATGRGASSKKFALMECSNGIQQLRRILGAKFGTGEAERLELHHGRGEGRQGHAQRFPVL